MCMYFVYLTLRAVERDVLDKLDNKLALVF